MHAGTVDGSALCRMFHQAIRKQSVPKYLSSDHDPLLHFHQQWKANLRILSLSFRSYQWQKHRRGLYQTPIAA